MRVRMLFNTQIHEDDEAQIPYYAPPDAKREAIARTMTKPLITKIEVPATDSLALDFGDIAAVKGFELRLSGAFTISMNGGTAVPVNPVDPDAEAGTSTGADAVCGGSFAPTSITLNNPAEAAITGLVILWGDPEEA